MVDLVVSSKRRCENGSIKKNIEVTMLDAHVCNVDTRSVSSKPAEPSRQLQVVACVRGVLLDVFPVIMTNMRMQNNVFFNES